MAPRTVNATTPTSSTSPPVTTPRLAPMARDSPRSRNGKANSSTAMIPGITTVPITSNGPGKYFSNWNNPRKYHSGRGT
jgi:hypothetical protein